MIDLKKIRDYCDDCGCNCEIDGKNCAFRDLYSGVCMLKGLEVSKIEKAYNELFKE